MKRTLAIVSLGLLAACTDTSSVNRFTIAGSAPNAYAGMPCTVWGLVAEQSMLGYQLKMRPAEVLADLGKSLPASTDFETLKLVMSGVSRFSFHKSDEMRISIAETYSSLVQEECASIRN